MSLQIAIANHFLEVENKWQAIVPENHCLNAQNLRSLQNSNLNDIDFFYVIIKQNDLIIGVAYFQQFWFSKKHLNLDNFSRINRLFISLILRKPLPLLICGNLFRIDFEGFYFLDNKNRELIFEVISLLEKQLKNKPWGKMIKDCSVQFMHKQVSINGFRFFNGDKTMMLKNNFLWSNFNDYLNSLKKDYFKRANKVLDSYRLLNETVLTSEDILFYRKEIDALYYEVLTKQRVKLGIVNHKYFFELKECYQNNFEMIGIFKNNKMIGFYTFIFYEKNLETHYIGLNYEANKEHKLYFNILFKSVEKLIDKKLNYLELGRTAREAKANIGASFKQINNYIQINNLMGKLVLKIVLKKFEEKENESVVLRNPFRK